MIQTNKRVESVEHTSHGIRVTLSDGSVEEGDIVIGADGVHSKVRDFMWDYASEIGATSIVEADKNAFFTEIGGMFGVSNQKDEFGLSQGESNVTYGYRTSKLIFTQPGKVYWAIMYPVEKSRPPKSLRVSDADMEEMAARLGDLPVTEKVKFRDLWLNRTRAGLIVSGEMRVCQNSI